jgi:hypothetical protein
LEILSNDDFGRSLNFSLHKRPFSAYSLNLLKKGSLRKFLESNPFEGHLERLKDGMSSDAKEGERSHLESTAIISPSMPRRAKPSRIYSYHFPFYAQTGYKIQTHPYQQNLVNSLPRSMPKVVDCRQTGVQATNEMVMQNNMRVYQGSGRRVGVIPYVLLCFVIVVLNNVLQARLP